MVDGCLAVGGVPVTRLAERAGRTPFYAYDRARIDTRLAALREHLPAAVSIHYAVKANPMPAVVQHLARTADGLDVASAGELRTALDTPVDPDQVSFAGPGKTAEELACAVAAGVTVNAESEDEVERLAAAAERLGVTARVAVRVNPDFELKTSGMKMGGGPRQFGIDAERVPQVLGRVGALGLDFRGFHIYSGSQNLRAEAIAEAQRRTFELAYRLSDHAPRPPRVINIGGGLGIPYFPGEEPLDLATVGAALAPLVEACGRRLPEAEVVMELGRFLVGEAGVYVCRVLERKISRDAVFLVTDGGLHHHLAASGNFGQVIRKNYPVVVANRMAEPAAEVASVVGPLCTPLDLLADRMPLPAARPGDLIAVLQSGAYGATASPTAFLGHPPPLELLV